ncbi:hypothetical protein [uncultured Campylobacter sp.]|uniref:hypothetical protein n=1 Tax=uncultured Campylobacter sp. TaxID=218934 RepID=UPI0026156417|nr:hypothetical protein [uncultured Campylobacter sp.]
MVSFTHPYSDSAQEPRSCCRAKFGRADTTRYVKTRLGVKSRAEIYRRSACKNIRGDEI